MVASRMVLPIGSERHPFVNTLIYGFIPRGKCFAKHDGIVPLNCCEEQKNVLPGIEVFKRIRLLLKLEVTLHT